MRLEYDFAIVGLDKIERAMASVESRFARHNSRMARAAGVGSPGAARAANPRAAIAATERETLTAERRIQAARERAEAHVFRVRMRYFQQQQRAEESAARKLAREKERQSAAQARASAASVRREMAERERFRQRTVGTLGSSVRGTVGGLGQVATGALAIGGGVAVAGAVSDQLNLGRRYNQLSIQSRAPGQSNPIGKREIQSRVEAVAVEHGLKREEVAGAVEVSVAKTGNLDEALRNLDQFATLAQAFNADTGDIAAAAAVLGEKFNLTGQELADTLATLGSQGRNAAFELKDMAALVEQLSAAGQRFDFTGSEGVKTLGGFTQIAYKQTGSAEKAATAVEATLRQLIGKSGDIQSGKAFGKKVNVFEGGDPTKNARDFREVIADVISASGGDKTKLQKVFGDEGNRAITGLTKAYSDANNAAGGGKAGDAAGRAAIEAIFKENIDAAGTYADAQKDAAEAMDDDAVRMTRATEQIAIALGQLSPIVVRLAETLASNEKEIGRAVDGVAKVADFLISNPMKGIGAIIAAKVIADLAAAAIGEKVAVALQALLRGGGGAPVPGGGSVPVPVGGPGGKSKIAKAAGALGAVGAATMSGYLAFELVDGTIGMLEAMQGRSDARERSVGNAAKDIEDLNGMKNVSHWDVLRDTLFTDDQQKTLFGRDRTSVKHLFADTPNVQFMSEEESQAMAKRASERRATQSREKESQKLDASELAAVAARMDSAATKQLQAAEKLASGGLNRGDSPTSPKK